MRTVLDELPITIIIVKSGSFCKLKSFTKQMIATC